MRMMFRIKDIDTAARLHAATSGRPRRPTSRHQAEGLKEKRLWQRASRQGRILGMGCSKFGERWDKEADDLMVEAFDGGHRRRRHREEADRGGLAGDRHRGAARRQVGRAARGRAAAALHPGDARRELLRQRHRGLPRRGLRRGLGRGRHRAGARRREAEGHRLRRPAAARPRPAQRHVLAEPVGARHASPSSPPPIAPSTTSTPEDLKRAMAHISVKSHDNGAANPKAHLRNKITIDTVLNAPTIAEPLGLYDCCGVSDGVGLRHRHHARDRQEPRQEGHDLGQGAAARGLERHARRSTTPGTAATSPPRASPPSAPTRRPASTSPREEIEPDRGARLLLGHRARDDGGPAHLARGRRHQGRARRLLRCRRQGALPDRRRPEVLRPSDRRVGHAHDLRDVPADAGPRRRAPAQEDAALSA